MNSPPLQSAIRYVSNFEWIHGQTPLAELQYPMAASCVYLAVIGALYKYKKSRSASELWLSIVLHNSVLVLVSALMFFGTLYEVVRLRYLQHASLFDLFCDPSGRFTKGPIYFWCYFFYLSKFYELVDTVFIVLKKKELTFLHIYHHVLTVNLMYLGMNTQSTNQWVALLFNTFVHILMYTYYTLVMFNIQVWWKKYLTTMQMIQFFCNAMGLFLWLYLHLTNPGGCSGHISSWAACLFVQVTFFMLFFLFYRKTYQPSDRKTREGIKNKKIE